MHGPERNIVCDFSVRLLINCFSSELMPRPLKLHQLHSKAFQIETFEFKHEMSVLVRLGYVPCKDWSIPDWSILEKEASPTVPC